MRYFVEISEEDGAYWGLVHQGDRYNARPLSQLNLGPEATVTIKGNAYRLDKLMEALIAYRDQDLVRAFDETGQLELGEYLYTQLFGSTEAAQLKEDALEYDELRIVSKDPHIRRLPWVLMASHGDFLSTSRWAISLAHKPECADCELPPSPHILIVAPQPKDVLETKAAMHLEDVENLLYRADHRHQRGKLLRVVTTWEEFVYALREFKPEVVYFYGHGVGNYHTSRLVFGEGEEGRKPIADIANLLKQQPERVPRFIYLNCCLGDAGGALGAGGQLGSLVPAVITNVTVARIDAAQDQAMTLLRSIIVDGTSPHEAISTMRSRIVDHGFSFKDVRWMTPVLHCNYGSWKANPPPRRSIDERDPQWRLKLDRSPQFSQIFMEVSDMLLTNHPRAYTYVWYGKHGQGVDLFHQRLKFALPEKFTTTDYFEVISKWNLHFTEYASSFESMMSEAFEVDWEQIPDAIRVRGRSVTGRKILVSVRQESLESLELVSPDVVREYVKWWDRNFVPRLEKIQACALLGISFVHHDTETLSSLLKSKLNRATLQLSSVTAYRLLGEMGRLDKEDLYNFLDAHKIRLPSSYTDQILDEILERTQGNYDDTLEALKDLDARGWDMASQRPDPENK